MVVGWLATMPTGRPSMRAERGDEVGGPRRPQLEELAVVDEAAMTSRTS